MSDIFENVSDKIQNISNRIIKDGKKYIQSAFSKGEEIGHKGKIKLEIEKLKWDLKQLYIELGRYISLKAREAGVMDFSHDDQYIRLLEKIENQRQYISERFKNMTSSQNTDNDDGGAHKLLDKPLS